jgi:Asp-tRNA(Asn)/Glu-tRNA(Gln) amidotransferase C subunit
VFGYLKNEVDKRQIDNLSELMEEITNCCRNMNEQMLRNIFENKKVREDVQSKMEHFEPFF